MVKSSLPEPCDLLSRVELERVVAILEHLFVPRRAHVLPACRVGNEIDRPRKDQHACDGDDRAGGLTCGTVRVVDCLFDIGDVERVSVARQRKATEAESVRHGGRGKVEVA